MHFAVFHSLSKLLFWISGSFHGLSMKPIFKKLIVLKQNPMWEEAALYHFGSPHTGKSVFSSLKQPDLTFFRKPFTTQNILSTNNTEKEINTINKKVL